MDTRTKSKLKQICSTKTTLIDHQTLVQALVKHITKGLQRDPCVQGVLTFMEAANVSFLYLLYFYRQNEFCHLILQSKKCL